MTRAFLGGEYDLGVAVRGKAGPVSLKLGVFDGNGIDAGPGGADKGLDNDQLKDPIGRATVDYGFLTAGLSAWYGKTIDYTRPDHRTFDRYRAAADVQLFLDLVPVIHWFVRGNLKLTAAWFHPMYGKTVGPAPGDPKADQVIAQVQAKF